jgi:deoxyribodipyrimidine photo-lyase
MEFKAGHIYIFLLNQMYSVCLFTRNLRADDNPILNTSEPIIPVFIVNHDQINSAIASQEAIQFMYRSVLRLKQLIPLLVLDNLQTLIDHMGNKPKHIYIMQDYTPYSKLRLANLELICKVIEVPDRLCKPPKIHKKFASYYLHNHDQINMPTSTSKPQYIHINMPSIELKLEKSKFLAHIMQDINQHTTSTALISALVPNYKFKYTDDLAIGSNYLSPFIKFGLISIRTLAQHILAINNQALYRQLFWREFYYDMATLDQNLLKYTYYGDHNQWRLNFCDDPIKFFSINKFEDIYQQLTADQQAQYISWTTANTSSDIVNAAIKQLNTTGFMYNRARLIAADYLIKHMQINWRLGELWFAKQLVDYDPIINNYNWQWVLGYGPSAQAPFRKMNTIKQAEQHDQAKAYRLKYL